LKGTEGRKTIKSKRVSGVEVGDIESDDEDLLLSRQEITTKLARSKKKIVKLESQVGEAEKYIHQFEYAVGKQNVDMDVLRKELYQSTKMNQPNNPIIVQVNTNENVKPTPTVQPQVQAMPASPAVTVRAEKKKSPPQVKQHTKPIEIMKEIAPTPVATVPAPVPAPEPEPITTKTIKRMKRIDPVGTSVIVFHPDTNPDLQHRHIHMNSSYNGTNTNTNGNGTNSGDDCISISLPNDIDFDSLVFELRSAVAEKVWLCIWVHMYIYLVLSIVCFNIVLFCNIFISTSLYLYIFVIFIVGYAAI